MTKYYAAFAMLLSILALSSNAQVNFNNQVIVYFKSGIQRNAPSNTTATISSSNILNVLSTYGIPTSNVVPSFPSFAEADTVITGSPKYGGGYIGEDSRQMNRAKIFTITITNTATKQNFINSLNAMSEVLYAETNGNVSNNIIPVDGRFNQQWGMRNTVTPNADIHLDGATNIFTGNPNSIIAIIDNGVDRVHNDLDAKILGGDNGFQIGVDGFGRQFSHGSHVAGIAAAISNNAGNNGVAGVDWQARIHPKNIFDGNGDPDITQSIIDAVNFNANVWTFNNSWGLTNGVDEFGNGIPGRYSITVRSAFAQAYRNNRVSCIAMGNHQVNSGGRYANVVAFPAGFNSGIIAVGATNINDGITAFSAQGAHIDVSAPGNLIWSTNFNNGYIDLSGTSMATPHVAGLASLLKGFNINLANDDIEQIIRLTADDQLPIGFDNAFGTGRINAQRALQTLQAPNTLQQLNTTGGTVFSTSASMTRIFLGFPGLPDAAYVVKRSEVRKAITLPAMCNTVGVWGRGVGTTGYREENGRCFGEGICEVVPGTLTAAGCTLQTWIYEVWSVNGQYLGFYPRAANNVVFQYTILGVPTPNAINGDDNFCITSNNYTVNNFRPGATIAWQVTPTGVATPNTPTLPQTTLTKNSNGVITLTATVTNACGTGGNIVITKPNIVVGTAITGYYTINSNYHQPLQRQLFTNNSPIWLPANQYFGVTAVITGANLTSNIWNRDASSYPFTWSTSGTTLNFSGNAGTTPYTQRNGIFSLTAQNACGTATQNFLWPVIVQSGSFLVAASPNPVSSSLNISFSEQTDAEATSKQQGQELKPLRSIKSKDRTIVTLFEFNSSMQVRQWIQNETSSKGYNYSVAGLRKGLYILQVDRNNQTATTKIIVE